MGRIFFIEVNLIILSLILSFVRMSILLACRNKYINIIISVFFFFHSFLLFPFACVPYVTVACSVCNSRCALHRPNFMALLVIKFWMIAWFVFSSVRHLKHLGFSWEFCSSFILSVPICLFLFRSISFGLNIVLMNGVSPPFIFSVLLI